jgi:hypothetical protein
MVAFLSAVLWLLLAMAIPASITKVMGDARTMERQVDAYFPSTLACGYKIRLKEANPPGVGGYCKLFGGRETDFREGSVVRVVGKESLLGFLVESIENL